jgi:hypothetical protein
VLAAYELMVEVCVPVWVLPLPATLTNLRSESITKEQNGILKDCLDEKRHLINYARKVIQANGNVNFRWAHEMSGLARQRRPPAWTPFRN